MPLPGVHAIIGGMQMDLFDFAQNRAAPPARTVTRWEEAGVTVWGRAWLANVHHICARFPSELKFGAKLLSEGRLQSCRVSQRHAQATFASRGGGSCVVNLNVRPLPSDKWPEIERVCDRYGGELFASDEFAEEALASLFEPGAGLLPEFRHLSFACSHCRDPFCLYRAATLLALAGEFDRVPLRLFELRGATRELMLTRAAQQQAGASEAVISEDSVEDVFGIEIVPDLCGRAHNPHPPLSQRARVNNKRKV